MNQSASFLPEDFVVETRERRTGLLAVVLFPVMILAVFAAFLVTNRQWTEVRAAQASVDQETERVAREISEMKSLEKIRAQMDAKAELARGLLEPVPRSVMLAVLTNTMPSNVALTSFELRTEQIKPAKVDAKNDAKNDAKADPKTRSARPAPAKPRSGAAAPEATPEPVRRRTHIVLVGLAPSLLEVGRWMTALERVPVFAAVRLELMEEKALDGVKLSEFRIAIRIEPEADLRAWDELDVFREGRLPDEFASSISGVDDESLEVKR
jgi:Tfp pilus assembly protein PilN